MNFILNSNPKAAFGFMNKKNSLIPLMETSSALLALLLLSYESLLYKKEWDLGVQKSKHYCTF